jgi:flavin-dependent dehydrogenase
MELNFTGTDLCAINGTRSAPETHYDIVVVGAGPSGIAAAIDAAKAGAKVLLVDENPVSGALMGNDIPLYFGGRMTAATQNTERMLEAIFMSMPALETAMDAGVELLLGTTAWGVYRNGPGVTSLPQQVVGLADSERSWLVGFDKIVLATGARDLAMSFPVGTSPASWARRRFKCCLPVMRHLPDSAFWSWDRMISRSKPHCWQRRAVSMWLA